jgi:hypothetical protein
MKNLDSLYGGSPGFSVYSCLPRTRLCNFCLKKSQDKSNHKCDLSTDLPGNQPGAIGLPNKPIAPGFSVVSKEKSKSGRPRKTFGNMRFYAFL